MLSISSSDNTTLPSMLTVLTLNAGRNRIHRTIAMNASPSIKAAIVAFENGIMSLNDTSSAGLTNGSSLRTAAFFIGFLSCSGSFFLSGSFPSLAASGSALDSSSSSISASGSSAAPSSGICSSSFAGSSFFSGSCFLSPDSSSDFWTASSAAGAFCSLLPALSSSGSIPNNLSSSLSSIITFLEPR